MRVTWPLALVALLLLAAGGLAVWYQQTSVRLADGLAVANGRIEVERVDIAPKLPGRVARIGVREGDFVERNAIVAELDTDELQARRASAQAAMERAVAAIGQAEAEIAIREAEHRLTQVEMQRAIALQQRAAGTVQEVDRRKAENAVAEARILGAKAALAQAQATRLAAAADLAQIEVLIRDSVLRAPVAGRIEYRLVQPGEVVAAGARVATLLDLSDAYMTIFLPTSEAGRVALGSPARIVLDAAPGYVFPARISFIAAEAQFTPKTVETQEERTKLMYRIKVSVEPALLGRYRDYVKAGLTGNAYVLVKGRSDFPADLAPHLPDVG